MVIWSSSSTCRESQRFVPIEMLRKVDTDSPRRSLHRRSRTTRVDERGTRLSHGSLCSHQAVPPGSRRSCASRNAPPVLNETQRVASFRSTISTPDSSSPERTSSVAAAPNARVLGWKVTRRVIPARCRLRSGGPLRPRSVFLLTTPTDVYAVGKLRHAVLPKVVRQVAAPVLSGESCHRRRSSTRLLQPCPEQVARRHPGPVRISTPPRAIRKSTASRAPAGEGQGTGLGRPGIVLLHADRVAAGRNAFKRVPALPVGSNGRNQTMPRR